MEGVGGSSPSTPTKSEAGAVVQSVRIPACHAGGRGFESRPLRQTQEKARRKARFFYASIFSANWVKMPDFQRVPVASSDTEQQPEQQEYSPMMDRFREGVKGPVAWILLGLLIVSFVFTGVSNFFVSGDADAVVKVNDAKITRVEYEQALQREKNRLGEMYERVAADPELEKRFRDNVLEQQIGLELLRQNIADLNLRIGDERIRAEIQRLPYFQRDGKFDRETAERLLVQNNLTIDRFRAQMAQDMAASQLLRGIADTGFVLPGEVTRLAQLDSETRSGRFVRIPASQFMPTDMPSDDEIQAHYKATESEYAVPEKVALQYIELNGEKLAASVTVSDEDVQKHYDSHQSDYGSLERRRVAHILLGTDGKSDDEVKKAADDLAAKLAAGEDFAALAKQYSDDAGSKEKGGELDILVKGEAVMPEAFDSAAFALTEAAPVSQPVKTDFGYHLIKLLAIEPAQVQSLDQVRDKVTEAVRADKLSALYAEKEQAVTEKGFEVSESLDEAAKAAGVEIQETGEFARNSPVSIAREPAVLAAVFADEVLNEGRNSALIPVGERRAVMVRVKSHTPASIKPLADVKEMVAAQLNGKKARAAAEAWGRELLAKLRAGSDVGPLLAEKQLSWEGFEGMGRKAAAGPDLEVRQELFRIATPAEGKSVLGGTSLAQGDFVLAEITKVERPSAESLDEAARQRYAGQLKAFAGENDYVAQLETLKKRADLKRLNVAASSEQATQ